MPGLQVTTRSGGRSVIDRIEVRRFQDRLGGELLGGADQGYDEARAVWNAMIDRRPAMIARCADTADVAEAVRFAREQDVLVSVKGGGHSVAGNAVYDDALMIDLSSLKQIRVDAASRTAKAQGGVRLGEFDRATQAHRLATTLGIASDTGIAGLTLGGGYGWLNGVFGLACDNLVAAEVVTADGRVLDAGPKENADLFWGIRGGGGNFGIVTTFEYRLHPMDRVLGGKILYPWSKAEDALKEFDRFARAAPDGLSTNALVRKTPDGSPVVAIAACYAGPIEDGEKLLEPLRSFGPPLADMIRPMPYVEMQSLLDEDFAPGRHYYWKTSNLRALADGAIDVLMEYGPKLPTPLSVIYLQQLHGAAARVGPGDTAFPHRYYHYDCGPLFAWEDPADSTRCIQMARELWSAMRPFYEDGVYLANLGEPGDARMREAFGPNYGRAVALKNKYDPTNTFRLNPNIKPTASSP